MDNLRCVVLSEYPGYVFSSDGRIQGPGSGPKGHGKPRWLKPGWSKQDYAHVTMYVDDTPANYSVHRLICIAFHGDPPSSDHHAAHANGNSRDNRAENLTWKTCLENIRDKHIHGTMARGERQGSSKLKEADVLAIRELYSPGSVTLAMLADRFGVTPTMVSFIVRRKSWKHI